MPIDYSIIIPAYNEEAWLPATLVSLQQAMAPLALQGELIVVDNNSDDTTAVVAREAGTRVVFEPYNQISRARNAGACAAKGRYLVFVDADTHIPPDLLARALDNLQRGECVGGGARVSFDVELNAAARAGLAIWNGLSRRLKLAAGCFIYCSREAYEATGGFSEAVYASEEIWFSRQLARWGRRQGKQFCLVEEPTAHSSGRKMAWFNTWQQVGLLLMVLLFPFFVRFKRLCGFWYKRPEHNQQ